MLAYYLGHARVLGKAQGWLADSKVDTYHYYWTTSISEKQASDRQTGLGGNACMLCLKSLIQTRDPRHNVACNVTPAFHRLHDVDVNKNAYFDSNSSYLLTLVAYTCIILLFCI